jgi:hypothetical protein
MSTKTTKNPGGRPPIPEAEKLTTLTFRGSIEHREKLAALGGGAWMRAQIDAAPWPRGTKPRK